MTSARKCPFADIIDYLDILVETVKMLVKYDDLLDYRFSIDYDMGRINGILNGILKATGEEI